LQNNSKKLSLNTKSSRIKIQALFMKNSLPLIIHVFLWFIAIVLAFSDLDSVSWVFMNISIFVGVFGILLIWNKTDKKLIGFGLSFLKLAITIFLMQGWWSLTFPELSQKSLGFFWGLSPFFIGFGLFETLIINKYFKQEITTN